MPTTPEPEPERARRTARRVLGMITLLLVICVLLPVGAGIWFIGTDAASRLVRGEECAVVFADDDAPDRVFLSYLVGEGIGPGDGAESKSIRREVVDPPLRDHEDVNARIADDGTVRSVRRGNC